MFFHLIKPIWKRKFKNLLLSFEILLAFIVVFGLALVSVRFFQLYHLPMGFEHQSVWTIEVNKTASNDGKSEVEIVENLTRSLKTLPEIDNVSFISHLPYSNSVWQSDIFLPDNHSSYGTDLISISDDAIATLQIKVIEGRAFSVVDEGASLTAVMINRKLAEQLFPGQSAVGKIILKNAPPAKNEKKYYDNPADNKNMRVTGVIEDFRNTGEFMFPTNILIERNSIFESNAMMDVILLKLKPETPRIFEAKLNQQLKMIRNDWTYTIAPMSEMRKSKFNEDTMPLAMLAVISSFLLLMVAFGLFGVLWQNTTQRIPEIGLRRAVGASSGQIYRQIIIEQLMLSSLAICVGIILLIQLPITGALGEFANWPVFLTALCIAMGIIYLLSILCALYPAWRASRLSPTQALHYE